MRTVSAAGVEVSAIGLGTWQFGSREWGYGDEYAESTAIEITHRALELGVTLIDTAEVYAFGRSEKIVGKALATAGVDRQHVFVASKVLPVLPLDQVVRWRGRASAGRLGTGHIDLYQVHWPNPVVPLSQTMAGMKRLLDDRTVRHVGVSNFSAEKWQEAEHILGAPVISNQVSYSLVQRAAERQVIPHALASDRIVIAYSPLAQGLLAAKYDGDNAPGGVRATNPLFLPDNLKRARPLLDTLRDVAGAHDATPAQIALAWVIRRPNVVAIPGASSVAQLEANVAAADIDLTEDENQRLTAAAGAFMPDTGLGAMAKTVRNRLPF
jgi:aryl-alcohol dehydrogenase-like predicted oxidoreductase